MIGKHNMFLFYFSITLAIASSALYHFTAKSTLQNKPISTFLLQDTSVAFIVTPAWLLLLSGRPCIGAELKKNRVNIGIWVCHCGSNLDSTLSAWGGIFARAVLVNVVASRSCFR
jgi:hypothetical protein